MNTSSTLRKPGLWYWAGSRLTAFLSTVLAGYKVEGKHHMPKEGPCIVVANHMSVVDPPVLGTSLLRPMHIMGKAELWERFHSRVFSESLGVIPVRRGEIDRSALRMALAVLQAGEVLALFPEGTRGEGRMQGLKPAHRGAALLALTANVPILPVGITGTEAAAGPSDMIKAILSRPGFVVNIGEPFILPQPEGPRKSDDLTAATETIMLRIAAQLPERYHGVYAQAAKSGADSLATMP